MSDVDFAKKLLRANGYRVTGKGEKFTAKASVVALVACVTLDFELTHEDGVTLFTAVRKEDGYTANLPLGVMSLLEVAVEAVDIKVRAERS
jgi:DNA-binding response OmpR family regulator